MSIWADKERGTIFDGAEDLACEPSGGRVKMWLAGVGVALVPLVYGARCLITGHAKLFARGASSALDVAGAPAVGLAVAYMAIGVFIHVHWFWGLHPRL